MSGSSSRTVCALVAVALMVQSIDATLGKNHHAGKISRLLRNKGGYGNGGVHAPHGVGQYQGIGHRLQNLAGLTGHGGHRVHGTSHVPGQYQGIGDRLQNLAGLTGHGGHSVHGTSHVPGQYQGIGHTRQNLAGLGGYDAYGYRPHGAHGYPLPNTDGVHGTYGTHSGSSASAEAKAYAGSDGAHANSVANAVAHGNSYGHGGIYSMPHQHIGAPKLASPYPAPHLYGDPVRNAAADAVARFNSNDHSHHRIDEDYGRDTGYEYDQYGRAIVNSVKDKDESLKVSYRKNKDSTYSNGHNVHRIKNKEEAYDIDYRNRDRNRYNSDNIQSVSQSDYDHIKDRFSEEEDIDRSVNSYASGAGHADGHSHGHRFPRSYFGSGLSPGVANAMTPADVSHLPQPKGFVNGVHHKLNGDHSGLHHGLGAHHFPLDHHNHLGLHDDHHHHHHGHTVPLEANSNNNYESHSSDSKVKSGEVSSDHHDHRGSSASSDKHYHSHDHDDHVKSSENGSSVVRPDGSSSSESEKFFESSKSANSVQSSSTSSSATGTQAAPFVPVVPHMAHNPYTGH